MLVTQHVVQELGSVIGNPNAFADWRAAVQQNPRAASLIEWLDARFRLTDEVRKFTENISPQISGVVRGSIWFATQLLITLFTLFYFFRDRWPVMGAIRSLVPLSDREATQVIHRVSDTIYATLYGGMTVALVQGTLGGLIFWFLGLPAPLLWGTVMFLVSIVPMLGAFVVWIPAALFLLTQGQWTKAMILAAWGAIAIGLIDNLLYPVLVGKRLRMHPLPVFFSIIGGIVVFGASGLILGPVALALLVAIIDIWRRRTVGGQPAEDAVQR